MFIVKDDKLIFGDSEIYLPNEVKNLKINKTYGTATCGLQSDYGYVIAKHGKSITVRLKDRPQAGFGLSDDIELTNSVFLREQIDPESFEIFWLVSKKPIKNQLNWINIEFTNGTILRICPFSFRYKVLNGTNIS